MSVNNEDDSGALSSNYSTFRQQEEAFTRERKYEKFSFKKLWKFTGPGFLMSIAYLDAGNLESDIQAGAQSGYKLLWVLFYSTLIGFMLQMLAVRLGSVTGFNLAQICHKEYSKYSRIFLWLMIEIAIVTSDIQQVIGSALALNLISQGYISLINGILLTLVDTFLFLFIEMNGLRVIEAVFGLFICIMSSTFLYMFIRVRPDTHAILKNSFVPWCSKCSYGDMKQLTAILGSIIMPHNLYFHSTLVLSRNIDRKNEQSIREANRYYFIESALALTLSFISNLFIMSVMAKTFFMNDSIKGHVTLFNIDKYIREDYGLVTLLIWSIGLLSASQASTMTATYTGQFVMQGFTQFKMSKFKRICLTRSIALVPAILIALLANDSIDVLNFWCNIIQSIQLPFALLPIVHFNASNRIMGNFKLNFYFKTTCYLISVFIIGINLYMLINLLIQSKNLTFYIVFGLILVLYTILVIFYVSLKIYG